MLIYVPTVKHFRQCKSRVDSTCSGLNENLFKCINTMESTAIKCCLTDMSAYLSVCYFKTEMTIYPFIHLENM